MTLTEKGAKFIFRSTEYSSMSMCRDKGRSWKGAERDLQKKQTMNYLN